jgi:hypothetical protein
MIAARPSLTASAPAALPALLAVFALTALALGGCATVKPFEREMLTDPIMDANLGFSNQGIVEKFFTTREGSIGCGTSVGGGCGCSK